MMLSHDPGGNCQSQSAAIGTLDAGGVAAKEAVKNARMLVLGNPDAVVVDVEHDGAVLRTHPHSHGAPLVAVADRVVHENTDQSRQQCGIADHRRLFERAVVERHASTLRLRLPARQFVGDHIVEKQRLLAHRGLIAGGIGARELEQFVHVLRDGAQLVVDRA